MKVKTARVISRLLLVHVWLLASCPHYSQQQQCKEQYVLRMGYCLYISNFTTNWCTAAAYCQSIGGELVMDLGAIRSLLGITNYISLGVTDLLVEQQTSRLHWRFANGSQFPQLGSPDWQTERPNAISTDDDSLVAGSTGLTDGSFSSTAYRFACQPIATPESNWLRRKDFLKLGNISPVYCYTNAIAENEFTCQWLCVQRWQCRAVLYNTDTGACRMLNYADASVGNEIESDPTWVKYVKQY